MGNALRLLINICMFVVCVTVVRSREMKIDIGVRRIGAYKYHWHEMDGCQSTEKRIGNTVNKRRWTHGGAVIEVRWKE